eukprot:10104059-Heterocapsa_arctica.AAC.1
MGTATPDAGVDVHEMNLAEYKAQDTVKDEFRDKKEPCVHWGSMQSFSKVSVDAMAIVVVDEDS